MGRRNRPDDFEALSEKEQAAYYDAVNGVYAAVMDIHRAMDAVYLDDSIGPEQKRAELDRLQTELNDLLNEAATGLKVDMEARE